MNLHKRQLPVNVCKAALREISTFCAKQSLCSILECPVTNWKHFIKYTINNDNNNDNNNNNNNNNNNKQMNCFNLDYMYITRSQTEFKL